MIAIRTERLELREFTMEDVEGFHAFESLPEVVRYQTFPPRSWEEAKRVVREIVEGQTKTPRAHTELAAVLDGRLIGRVGSWTEGNEARLWYSFHPLAQGRGCATETVRAFIGALPASRFVIECDPRNEPSWRLAERLGFVRESHSERAFENKGEWVGSFVYGFNRPDAAVRPAGESPDVPA